MSSTAFPPSTVRTPPTVSASALLDGSVGARSGECTPAGLSYFLLMPAGVLSMYGKPWMRFTTETEFKKWCATYRRLGWRVRKQGTHFASVHSRNTASGIVTRMGEDKQRAGFVAKQ